MNLNYIAPLNSLGYGIVGVNILSEFLQKYPEDNISVFPIGNVDGLPNKTRKKIIGAINNNHNYDVNAPSIRIWHQHDLSMHVGNGTRIGWPIFELDELLPVEYSHIDRQDYVFVCSEWAKKIITDKIPTMRYRVMVVPLGVNREIFNENVGEPDESCTTFLNIGKWEYRKGHDIIHKAFEKAFDVTDNVRLWMMCDNPFIGDLNDMWKMEYKQSRLSEKISFLPRVDTPEKVAIIMSRSDCGVFPSRAEGWNLELLEMMSMGKPVIATDYSAHTEFCNNDNALLLEVKEKEIANDGNVFFGDKFGHSGKWAKLDEKHIDKIAEYMRFIHKNKLFNSEGVESSKEFTWKKSIQKIEEYLDAIHQSKVSR